MGKSELNEELQEAVRRKDWRGAVDALNRLARLEPRYAPHRLKIGDNYTKLKDTAKAIASYQKAAELFGGDGFIVKALAAYKIILRIDPQNKTARTGMEGLHSNVKEQALDLSMSLPKSASVLSGAGGTPAPIMDAWEISKTHLLKDIEKTATEPPAGSAGQEDSPVSPSGPPPALGQTGAPAQAQADSPPSPPAKEEEEELDEGFIGSTPIDLDAYDETKRAEVEEGEDASPVPASASADASGPESSTPSLPQKPEEAPVTNPFIPSVGGASNVLTLFASLTKEEFAEVTDRMIPYLFDPGSKIVSEGDEGDSVFVVSSGTVRVSTQIGNKEVVLAELKDDDFFGEVSFLTGRPRTADIVASTATEILELSGDDLRAVIEKFPRVHAVLEEFHRVRALDTVEKIIPPPPTKGPGDEN